MNRTCTNCGSDFLVPPAEQEFRTAHNLTGPDRCSACRVRDRQARNAEFLALYDQGDSPTFRPNTNGGVRTGPRRRDRSPGRTSDGPRQMYNTVCAQCGDETRVPFVPRGDRPVYCRDCYNARRGT